MDSRLDRLFILIDTGSSESIRLAAAKQLGEVQRVQPNDLNHLLHRIKEYSSKPTWETRVAAGHATSCVLEQVEPWPYHKDNDQKQDSASKVIDLEVDIDKIIDQFDLNKVISTYQALLSVNAIDTDDSPSSSRGTTSGAKGRHRDKEVLMRQRKLINKELGLGMVDQLNIGVKSTDIVSNDDLQANHTDSTESALRPTDLPSRISNCDLLLQKLLADNLISNGEDNCWPLSNIAKSYIQDLFNPAWEVRHGAAIALREIVRLHGKCGGKHLDLSEESNQKLNQLWLVDTAMAALCVLALDRFGDFLFDQVIAPVRENAAQFFGCCVAAMTEHNAYITVKLLLKMLTNSSWEVRHGGIIGLKYSLNVVDASLSKKLLCECFDSIFKLLDDSVDDVSAEAAAALVPVKDLMLEIVPEKTPKLIKFLWEHLADLDEITTSTSNIILLLASLITSSSSELETDELIRSMPRLWPLMSHPSTTVRVSVLKALSTLLRTQKSTCLTWMPEQLLSIALRLVYQRSILENMEEVRPHIEEVWSLLIRIDEDPEKSQNDKFNLLKSTSQYLNFWLCLSMQPSNAPIDRGNPMWLNLRADGSISSDKPDGDIHIGSITFNAETLNQQKSQVTRCRLLGSKMIGALYSRLVCDTDICSYSGETLKYLSDMFAHYIKTKSAYQRIYSGWALESWAVEQIQLFRYDYEKLKSLPPKLLTNQLNIALQEETLCFDELASNFTRLQQETREFVSMLKEIDINLTNISINVSSDYRAIYNLNQIQMLCDLSLETELSKLSSKKTAGTIKKEHVHDVRNTKNFTLLSSKKMNLSKTLKSTTHLRKTLSTSVLCSIACAMTSWRLIPEKLSLIAGPLLDSIEREEDQLLQDKSIKYLIIFFDILCQSPDKHSVLIDEMFQKLINLLSSRELSLINSEAESSSSLVTNEYSKRRNSYDGNRIILLDQLQRKAEQNRQSSRRQSGASVSNSTLKRSLSTASSNDLESDKLDASVQPEISSNDLAARGASQSLKSLAAHFGEKLPEKLPSFWNSISTSIGSQIEAHLKVIRSDDESQDAESETKFIKNLLLLEVVGKVIDKSIQEDILKLFDQLVKLLPHPNSMLRHRISQCLGVMSELTFDGTVNSINQLILPMLELADNTLARCGAIEAIASIIEHLQLELVPRIDVFIIHVLRRMSDQNDQVRLMATHCFGKLLSLMPLNLHVNVSRKNSLEDGSSGVKEEPKLEDQQQRDEQRFIEQLLNPKKLDEFTVPFKMNASLRSYQQDGLNWLSFLNRFNLHGILCDEMGLGKTFMTICIVASNHYLEGLKQAKIQDVDDKNVAADASSLRPSLIICPSTLTQHWLYEIIKFVPENMRSILNPVAYIGTQMDRANLRVRLMKNLSSSIGINPIEDSKSNPNINLVVSSYDIVRNDIDFFKSISWNYCVLDEGHIIKNGQTKLAKSIKLLSAKRRLILSGTPIQNNVTELWSLFDFLMPGYLGSERQFNNRYAKPILQSKEPKCSPRELEAGALAMESLHRQVLPFILRRLKEDVLDDLPPKIIQDYYCELSPLQHKLYEDFTRSKLCKNVTKKSLGSLVDDCDEEEKVNPKSESKSHVFQALQYLKNVCNHPKLVLTAKHPQYLEIKKGLDAERSSLDDINHSSKLKALKQLLLDCGIGLVNQSTPGEENQQPAQAQSSPVVNQHRALIFCQVRSMVNIIENDLLRKHLQSITYLKLDGSVPPNQRQTIVSRFNDDPSIDILLLTTQIGGLGLNLTGADTVIFVEHDWNPTKDLQAMDRAHRIGQKKVVNVYRLITKSTLEDKIMGLQKFKTMVSNTVINQDNTGLGTMNVDQLFDLFDSETNESLEASKSNSKRGQSSFVNLLPELWDQQQYETEYDLSNFVSSLKN